MAIEDFHISLYTNESSSIDPYAFAISNQIDAAKDFLALASFNTDQTMDKCSQQPGTFSMQPFCTDKLMILLFWTRWLTNRLEIRLKKSLPSTFKRAIGRKPEIKFLDGVLIWKYRFPLHFAIAVVFHPLRRHISKFEKEIYLIWNTFYTLCMECHYALVQMHFYKKIIRSRNHCKRSNLF